MKFLNKVKSDHIYVFFLYVFKEKNGFSFTAAIITITVDKIIYSETIYTTVIVSENKIMNTRRC